jgi:hypothetical protein
MLKKLVLFALVGLSVCSLRAADVPSQLEGAATTNITQVNPLGRDYEITGFVTKVRGDTATTNTVTIALVNSQDTDLTGTNATATAITYDLKASGSYTGGYAWFPTTEKYRVPSGASLKITFTGGCTNDFVVFRSER